MVDPTTPVVPPKAGGLTSDDVPWTGGFRNTLAQSPKTPYCLRPGDYKGFTKVYEMAIKGLERRFGNDLLDYPLLSFCKKAYKHMADTGMDSVFYFEKGGREFNILEHYTAFTLTEIETAVDVLKLKGGDGYDINHLNWSATFLLNSITLELEKPVLLKIPDTSVSGPVLWMHLVQYVESNTATAHQALLEQLKQVKLTNFTGENVKKCTEKLSTLCRRLELADELPKNIGMLICDAMVTCSVEEFRFPFITLRAEFDLNLKYKNWAELIIIADRRYQSLLDSEKWIKANPDRAGAGFIAEGLIPGNKFKEAVVCNTCGKKGHYARECRSKTQKVSTILKATPLATPRKDDNKNSWKKIPPGKDVPHTQTSEGQTFYWCGKCKRWTLSHLTAAHASKSGPEPAAGLAEGQEEGQEKDAQTVSTQQSSSSHLASTSTTTLSMVSGF